MKSLFGILLCISLVLICTYCERVESLNDEFSDVYGTWKLVEYGSSDGFMCMYLGIDNLTIVRSDEKKFIGKFPNKFSKFADYQSYRDGELFSRGEVFILEQYDDAIQIHFTNSAFNGSNQVTIESLDANEMIINTGIYNYSLIKVINPHE